MNRKVFLLLLVSACAICGCDKKSITESIEIANRYDNVFLEIGFHPSEANITTDKYLEELEELVKSNNKVVAIGEIGLDYHWDKDNKEKQKELFIKQINIAKELNLPIVIHSRDAFQDTYDILKISNHKGVIHCFSGNLENAKMYLKLGYYLGIGGVVTFKNTNLKETIKAIGLDKILLETDSPYLAPTNLRGTKNEPKNILLIAEELSNILNISLSKVEEKTTKNIVEIFGIKID